jgi:ectoine hydroxylase-related dioxygenase (phytanoyl-CoA dioxygenase family)
MEGKEDYIPVYSEVQRMEEFHALAHDAALLDPLEKVLEEKVLVHPMKIGRISFPNNVQNTTAAHQDYVHIQGSFDTFTSWISLGDVPRDLGGLAVLAGSHKLGVLQPKQAYGAGGLGLDTDQYNLAWHNSDFQVGDVLLFLSNTVHKALPNLTQDRLRLSTDYRFTGITHAICETNLRVHFSWQNKELTFENLYKNWKNESLKYYWKKQPIHVVPYTEAWYQTAKKDEKK